MRKLFFILGLITLLFACNDDDNTPQNPIQNLKLPTEGTIFLTGQSVTIEGQGFTTESQIWLRGTGEVQAKVIAVNENSITFEVPEGVEGQQSVILKQNGQEYILGKITLKIGVEELYASMFNNSKMGLYKLNLTDKTYELVYESEENMYGLSSSQDGKIYYVTYSKENEESALIQYFDLKNKTVKTITTNWSEYKQGKGIAIGLINNELHAVRYNSGTGFYLVKIDNSGNETLVITFGKVSGFDNDNFSSGYEKFEYHPKDNIIVISGDYDKTNNVCIALDLTAKKVSSRQIEVESTIQCIYIDNDCYLFGHTEISKTTFRKINPSTLENLSPIQTIQEYISDLYYWKNKNIILGFDSNKDSSITLKTLDLSTKEIKPIWENVKFIELVSATL